MGASLTFRVGEPWATSCRCLAVVAAIAGKNGRKGLAFLQCQSIRGNVNGNDILLVHLVGSRTEQLQLDELLCLGASVEYPVRSIALVTVPPLVIRPKGKRSTGQVTALKTRAGLPITFDQPMFDPSEPGLDSACVNLGDITFDLVYAGTEMADKKSKEIMEQ